MNCRHDVPAHLGRRGLRDQPSWNCWWDGDQRMEKWWKSILQKKGSNLPSCVSECLKKEEEEKPRLIHIGFSERSREKGGLEDWMVSTDVMSHNWRNISVMGVWRVWNYSCNFSEYIFGVPRCTIKYLFVVTSSVRGEICVCVEWRHQGSNSWNWPTGKVAT